MPYFVKVKTILGGKITDQRPYSTLHAARHFAQWCIDQEVYTQAEIIKDDGDDCKVVEKLRKPER